MAAKVPDLTSSLSLPATVTNLRWPDKPPSLAAVGRIAHRGIKAKRIKPCSFWCEGCAKAQRRRSFAGGHAAEWELSK